MNVRRKDDTWVCRDIDGLLHVAKVERYFDSRDRLVQIQACTACRPRVQSSSIPPGDWAGTKLPPLMIGNNYGRWAITLIEFRIQEAPTCVHCVVMARPS